MSIVEHVGLFLRYEGNKTKDYFVVMNTGYWWCSDITRQACENGSQWPHNFFWWISHRLFLLRCFRTLFREREILDGYNGSSTLPPSHHSRLSGANSEEHWDQNFLTARNWNKPRTGRTRVPVLQQTKVHELSCTFEVSSQTVTKNSGISREYWTRGR